MTAQARSWLLGAAGVLLLAFAWALPAQWRSTHRLALESAGRDTPGLARLAEDLMARGKAGPASLCLGLLRRSGAPDRAAEARLAELAAGRPQLAQRGTEDLTLDLALSAPGDQARAPAPAIDLPAFDPGRASSGALAEFLPEENRRRASAFLSASRLPGVAELLRTRSLPLTRHFLPVNTAAGAPLEATILLCGVLVQADGLSPSLARDLIAQAAAANRGGDSAALEDAYLALLSLSRRLDWGQLTEVLREVPDLRQLGRLRTAALASEDGLPLACASLLLSRRTEAVLGYLSAARVGARDDLRLALLQGSGALHLLLDRALPVDRSWLPAPAALCSFAASSPAGALVLRIAAIASGAWLLLLPLGLALRRRAADAIRTASTRPWLRDAAAAALALGLFLLSEPHLRLPQPPPAPVSLTLVQPFTASLPAAFHPRILMNATGLATIALFLLLQGAVYYLCLRKIAEIQRQAAAPLVKLRLLENEDNLFDLGLYVGIGGTALSLIVQVLDLVPHNLLAAYSSNLMGIVFVALVKIRHVRPYRRLLILESGAVPAARP